MKKSAMRPDPSHRHKFLRPACKYPQLKLATQPGMKQMAELALSGLYKSWTKNTSIRIPSVRRIGDPLFVQVQWFSFDGKEAENVFAGGSSRFPVRSGILAHLFAMSWSCGALGRHWACFGCHPHLAKTSSIIRRCARCFGSGFLALPSARWIAAGRSFGCRGEKEQTGVDQDARNERLSTFVFCSL